MSEEQNKNEENTPVEEIGNEKQGSDFDKRRKLLKGALGATPVLMTVAARPVNAAQGLSNMLSLELSGCRGDDKFGGLSPGGWKNPGGTIAGGFNDSRTTIQAWNSIFKSESTSTFFTDSFGTPINGDGGDGTGGGTGGGGKKGAGGNGCKDYTGGVTVKAAFAKVEIAITDNDTTPLRRLLCGDLGNDFKRYAQGLLNVLMAEELGVNYIVTKAQFKTYFEDAVLGNNSLFSDVSDLSTQPASFADAIADAEDLLSGSGCTYP